MRHQLTRIVVATVVLGISAPATAIAASTATGRAAEPSASAVAVKALLNEPALVAARAVPADFAAVMGYRPERRDGRLVDPDGGCSTPIPLPAEFSLPCAEHDLGYDLLRYAQQTGEQVGGWARNAVDERLSERMLAACAARSGAADRAVCTAAATTATAGIELNSMRQLQQVPEETVGSLLVSALAAAAAVGALSTVVLRARARRRTGRRSRLRRPGAGRGVPA